MYRQIFFEVLDYITTSINQRFSNPGYKVFSSLEEVVVKAANREAFDLETIRQYRDDINFQLISVQLELLPSLFDSQGITLSDVIKAFQNIGKSQYKFWSEVIKLLQLIVLLPATNASSERVFSTLRRVKTYTRNSMMQSRLNHILTIVAHSEMLTVEFIDSIVQQFCTTNSRRMGLFGRV